MNSASPTPLVFICVNGILNNPGESDGWTDRAVTWLNLRTPAKAEKFEYATTALLRRWHQQARADAIAKMARFYQLAGYELVFIGHSNGCDLIERVLEHTTLPVRSVHFFAPACDGETLHRALQLGHVARAFLYGSPFDRALEFARISRELLGWIKIGGAPLGYGSLGLQVAEFALQHPTVTAHEDDLATHSSWFERGLPFENTMGEILRNEFGQDESRPAAAPNPDPFIA